MGCGKRMETMGFRPALRLARRKVKVWLENDKKPSRVWSNYDKSRGIERPIQRLPKVGHFSVPRGEQ